MARSGLARSSAIIDSICRRRLLFLSDPAREDRSLLAAKNDVILYDYRCCHLWSSEEN